MKRIISLVIVIALSLQVAVAQAMAANTASMTLSQAKELALEKARTLQSLKINREKLGVSADVAENMYLSLDINNTIDGYTAIIISMKKEVSELDPATEGARIAELQGKIAQYEAIVSTMKKNKPSGSSLDTLKTTYRSAADSYEDMERIIEDTEKTLELTVENLFFGIIDLDNTLQAQSKYQNLLGKQIQIERLKKELGLGTDLDITSIIAKYESTLKLIADIKSTRELLCQQFNDLIGLDAAVTLQLQPEEIKPFYEYVDLNSVVEKALENSLLLQQKEREIKNYAADYRTQDDSDQRKILRYSQELAKLELEGERESIKQKVKGLVDSLANTYKAWEIEQIGKRQAELNYNYDKQRYDLGMVSQMQLLASELTYINAAAAEAKAAGAWLVARHKVELAKQGIFIPDYE